MIVILVVISLVVGVIISVVYKDVSRGFVIAGAFLTHRLLEKPLMFPQSLDDIRVLSWLSADRHT